MLTDTTLTKAGISHGRTNHFYYTENEDGTCTSSIPEGTGVIDGGASCESGRLLLHIRQTIRNPVNKTIL